MKRTLCLLLAATLTLASAAFYGQSVETAAAEKQSYEEIFEKDRVIVIEIEISEEDLQDIYANASLEEYHGANITVDGVKMENVGIRTKGNSSLGSVSRSESDRYSYRIKFNKYVKGQKLLGLDEMVINNMYSDASYMREYLSYEAMREAGMDAPLAVFANIYINGELTGFYLAVEALEDSFLERSFGNNDGNLYKQEQGSTLIYSENSEYASSELKVGDDTEKTALKNMIKVLNEQGDYESVLDVESCLKLIAANTVLGSYDSYNGQMAHNYYLYEQDGVFSALPWDYNMSFGGFGQGGSGWSVSLDTPVSGVSAEQRPLINNLLSVPEYKAEYLEYVKQFAEYLEKMPERTAELANIVRQYVEADPTKFVTIEQFENSIIYVEEQERTGQGLGERGGMGMAMPEGVTQEVMQKAMEIIRSAGASDLTEEQSKQLSDLGLTDEQITSLKSIPQGGGRGSFSGFDGGMERSMPPANGTATQNSGNTRGNTGNMGNRGGGMNFPADGAPPEGAGQNERIRPEGGVGGMGMGGGSIITYSTNRLENINSQLAGIVMSDL